MKINNALIGEVVLLFSSILIFRSVWTMLDSYLGQNYLAEILALGIIMMIFALYMLNHEAECKMNELKTQR